MSSQKTMGSIFAVVFLLVCFVGTADASATCGSTDSRQIAEEMIGSSGITWMPKVNYAQLDVRVSRPDGTVFQKTFSSGSTPYLDLSSIAGTMSVDGQYMYELRVTPAAGTKRVRGFLDVKAADPAVGDRKALVQSGSFRVQGGSIVASGAAEEISRPQDVLHYDDVIITGSLCVGNDCADGESFGFCTLKLKENNMQICFEDTSTGTFPTNDWKIQTNDSSSGGASYFTIWDTDGGVRPFTIEAGAPSNSLYVDDYGRVGFGTSVPFLELHIVDGDSPAIRLDQDTSSGWTAQVFDIACNESNFFVRDVTGGSKLSFRIQPGTPTNTLTLRADGKVGIGTWSPTYPLEVETTGVNSSVVCDRTDGASIFVNATTTNGQFGTITNHPCRILVDSAWKLQLNSDNSLSMASGASCTAGGAWTNASSRALKENIQSLGSAEALNTLNNLSPVKFNYKADKAEKHVGFIAEDAPELVATKDRKGMSPMDVVAVLTRVVQEQQKTIARLEQKIAELEKK